MDLASRPSASKKAAIWKARKQWITDMVSQGFNLEQIEDELIRSGCRVNSGVREHITWELRTPEVRALFAQGLDIKSVQETLCQAHGWMWAESTRRKALWEFHREEIINLYTRLHSVEAVREHMLKKGFQPAPRVYYEWLRLWGIPTSINRSTLLGMAPESHDSPFDSNYSSTPGSTTTTSHQVVEFHENPTPDMSRSCQTPGAVQTNLSHQSLHQRAVLNNYTVQEGINVYQAGGTFLEVESNDTFRGNPETSRFLSQSKHSTAFSNKPQASTKSHSNLQSNVYPIPAHQSTFYDGDGDSDKSENIEAPVNGRGSRWPYAIPLSSNNDSGSEVPLCTSFNGEMLLDVEEKATPLKAMVTNQIVQTTSQKMTGIPVPLRDSGYASKTNSLQTADTDFREQPRPLRNVRSDVSKAINYREWECQLPPLHAIPCDQGHQGLGWNASYRDFNCCGSSSLQELAHFATDMPPQRVFELLFGYLQVDGARLQDEAGNTFLHMLATTGAPWEYFQAAVEAGINIHHQNAHGQTFAHVLNVSKLHDNLVFCLSSLRNLGLNLTHRDHSGRTFLHCLYRQPIEPQIGLQVLQLLDSPGQQLSLRDASGATPYEIFKDTYLHEASKSHRWSSAKPPLQILGIFEGLMEAGGSKLRDNSCDLSEVAHDQDELRQKLQNQYKMVIDKARYDISMEAVDGSNAIHSQAALLYYDTYEDLISLEEYLARGIDVDSYDTAGRTCLEATITQPRNYETELTTSEKVCLLVDKGGANVHSRNRLGQTPIYSAAIRGLDRTVEALLLRNAHVNVRANDGKSLLDAVIEAGYDAFLDYLMSGRQPYHEAQCSRIEACRILIEKYGGVREPTLAQAFGYPISHQAMNPH